MDLMCRSRTTINTINTVYFFMCGLFGLLFAKMPDRFGCQRTTVYLGTVSLIAVLVCIFCTNYWVRLVCFAVLGITQTKNGVVYAWISGINLERDKSLLIGIINAWDQSQIILIMFYYNYVSRNWFPLYLGMAILAAIAHLVMIFLSHESPKWLLC